MGGTISPFPRKRVAVGPARMLLAGTARLLLAGTGKTAGTEEGRGGGRLEEGGRGGLRADLEADHPQHASSCLIPNAKQITPRDQRMNTPVSRASPAAPLVYLTYFPAVILRARSPALSTTSKDKRVSSSQGSPFTAPGSCQAPRPGRAGLRGPGGWLGVAGSRRTGQNNTCLPLRPLVGAGA